MRNIVLAALFVGSAVPATAAPQGACPPDEPRPRRLVERIALEPAYQPALAEAGIQHLDVGEIRVLSPESDGPVCGRLNARVKRHHEAVHHARGRWTFYEAQGRYLVIYWLAPEPPDQPPTLNLIHVTTAWIYDHNLNLLTSFMM